ncbi:MAG TPA: polysaccharide pyruvyl transferase family protein [Trebonia sp.]|jgi:polysaccharide pyruvyl transferase WcaK-like protein
MTSPVRAASTGNKNAGPRVGLFGLLGSGNSGNQASAESVLAYLRRVYPDAEVDAMSSGCQWVRDNYGIPAIPLFWQEKYGQRDSRAARLLLKIGGKLADPLRIFRWVGGHDVVIVPGMGVFEATLPLHAYGVPLLIFVLSAAGRLRRVRVAFVSVGGNVVRQRATRWLFLEAARLAGYRSFRDEYSKTAMNQQGLDTSRDFVYPDLAFASQTPPYDPGDERVVAVGVMDYHGGNDDRVRAAELHAAYLEEMTRFTAWLIGNDYRIRFFGGDDTCDYTAADEIITRLGQRLSVDLVADSTTIVRFGRYAEMLEEMNRAGTVVATRFHNVVGGLLLRKPTIAIGYSRKFTSLMEDTGLAEFVQPAREVSADWLIARFTEAQDRRAEISALVATHAAARAQAVEAQFAVLSTLIGVY